MDYNSRLADAPNATASYRHRKRDELGGALLQSVLKATGERWFGEHTVGIFEAKGLRRQE
jgi:hypothetical protein